VLPPDRRRASDKLTKSVGGVVGEIIVAATVGRGFKETKEFAEVNDLGYSARSIAIYRRIWNIRILND
jgi:hypothetical protein